MPGWPLLRRREISRLGETELIRPGSCKAPSMCRRGAIQETSMSCDHLLMRHRRFQLAVMRADQSQLNSCDGSVVRNKRVTKHGSSPSSDQSLVWMNGLWRTRMAPRSAYGLPEASDRPHRDQKGSDERQPP